MVRYQSSPRRALRVFVVFAMAGLLGGGVTISASPVSAAGGTYTVTSNGDRADAKPGDRICLTSVGTCTLRAALTEDRLDGTASTIRFAIPGTGVHTISITSPLGTLTDTSGPTTIDGYSQSGSRANRAARVDDAVIKVEIRGTGSSGPEAMVIQSPRNTVRGLAFYNLRQTIRMEGTSANANVIAGNFLGTDAAGAFNYTAFNGNSFGIVISSGASRNIIGGPAVADRNVISGNAGRGVLVQPPATSAQPTDDNVVQNNLIGLTPNGLARRSNLGHGVDVNAGASRTIIKDNVVSGNNAEGVEISHGFQTVGNQIVNNRIGTDPTGTAGPAYARNTRENVVIEDGVKNTIVADNVIGNNSLGGVRIDGLSEPPTGTIVERNRIGLSANGSPISNGPSGVLVQTGATDNVIGPANEIAFNNSGVQVTEEDSRRTIRNTITQNSIHDNTGLGIDLSPIGVVNRNDPGDGDAGPNQSLNWPQITNTTATTATGTTCANCVVEVFLSDSSSTDPNRPSSYGEGKALLARRTASSGGNFTVPFASSKQARVVTATATDPAGDTSEFSLNHLVPKAPK